MNDKSTKKADAFLQTTDHDLQALFAKIKLLEELNKKVSAFLEGSLKSSCQVANMVDRRLILLVANGSVATQLRFMTPDLLIKFKHDPVLKKIQSIQCIVRPTPIPAVPQKSLPKMPPLSRKTAEIVREIAESMDDKKLKEVFLRIAEHTE